MQYACLTGAILIEVAATTLLEYSEGFTRLGPGIACFAMYGLCSILLSRALLRIDLGIAYATWCSAGIVVTSILAALLFGQKLSPAGVVGIVLILTGCILVNLFGQAG